MKFGLLIFLCCTLLIVTGFSGHSQGIAINSDGQMPDSSAQLDVASLQKGFLVPRLTTAQRNSIQKPARALLIFNTTSGQFEVNTGTPPAPAWEGIVTLESPNLQNGFWKIGGNVVDADTGQIGTQNNKPMQLVTANTMRIYIDTGATRIGINTTSPKSALHIATTDAIILPTGTTAQRPVQPVVGMIRFNNETGKLEGYTLEGWKSLQ